MSARDYAYALFDVGATVCLARRPRCDVCPLRRCSSRERVAAAPPPPPPGRQPAYAGSLRQLRGAVLRTMLADAPPHSLAALRQRVAHVPAASRKGAVEEALSGLRSDGLLREE